VKRVSNSYNLFQTISNNCNQFQFVANSCNQMQTVAIIYKQFQTVAVCCKKNAHSSNTFQFVAVKAFQPLVEYPVFSLSRVHYRGFHKVRFSQSHLGDGVATPSPETAPIPMPRAPRAPNWKFRPSRPILSWKTLKMFIFGAAPL
jgi:hypothetical protein